MPISARSSSLSEETQVSCAKSINHLATADNLFFGKGALDRRKTEKMVDDALAGCDDGELFLEYEQSESLAFDDGKLKSASFDTTQGFGLRSVAGEATGFAHASALDEQALKRAVATVKAVRAGHSGEMGEVAARHQPAPLCRRQPDRRRGLRQEGGAAAGDRRLCARQGAQGAPGLDLARGLLAGRRDHQGRRLARRRRAAAGAAERQRGLRRRQPHGSRQHRLGPARRLRRHLQAGILAARGRRGDPPVAGQPAVGAGAGRRDAGGAGLGLVGRAVARGGGPRAGRRLPSQEDVDVHQHDGRHDRLARRHRGRRRHARRPPRLAHHRRRGHADPAQRADRERPPGRPDAGPPERAPDGRQADRQRPAPEPRLCADAAHDQHLHAGRRQRIPRRSSPR